MFDGLLPRVPTVYDEFASVPAPPMNSSRRVSPEFMATYEKTYGDFGDRKRAAGRLSILEPNPQYYVKQEARDKARVKELIDVDSVRMCRSLVSHRLLTSCLEPLLEV